MSERLPLALKPIFDAEENRPHSDEPIRHILEFDFSTRSLATFESQGPILTPVVGQEIVLHGVALRVTDVEVSYEVGGDGRPSVFTTVLVELPGRATEQ
ncbi:hypothetical protein ABMX48_37195 [Streptomyces cavourensis]